MKLAIVFLVLISVWVFAESEKMQDASLDQQFKLRIGQQIEIKKEKLQIKFISVPEDSRCPKGEQCITQGNARVELKVIQDEKEAGSISLNTAKGSSVVDYHGYTIHLVSLNPYPVMNQSISSEEYEATLEVSVTKNRE